jgi:hypothetical protein
MRIFRSKGDAVRFPLVTSFCIASTIFAASTFIGYKAALLVSYRHSESKAFASLGTQDANELRTMLQTFTFLSHSRVLTKFEPSAANYHSALERNIPYLQKLRDRAPELLRPPIDLQLATDYAEMARLEKDAGHLAEAGKAMQSAQNLLGSLGWQNLSVDALNSLADQEIQPPRISGDKK